MKKKSIDLKKKLVLGKETLAPLSKKEQEHVGGGGPATWKTCPPQHTAFVSCEGSC